MPIALQNCGDFPLSENDATELWRAVRSQRDHADDDIVAVRCVPEDEMLRLNAVYRGRKRVTNVLTFIYEGEHDIALCLPVVRREAQRSGMFLRDYCAWLLVHALLHVIGMDHVSSTKDAKAMHHAEEDVLHQLGFVGRPHN